jgi:hypothetical protein
MPIQKFEQIFWQTSRIKGNQKNVATMDSELRFCSMAAGTPGIHANPKV